MATRERATKRGRAADRTTDAGKGVERAPLPSPTLSGAALYRAEKARRAAQLPTAQALEEARREFEQMLREARPAGTGGRPKKKPAPSETDIPDLDELGETGEFPVAAAHDGDDD